MNNLLPLIWVLVIVFALGAGIIEDGPDVIDPVGVVVDDGVPF